MDYRQYLEIPSLLICTLAYCLWLSFTVVSDTISPQVWPLVWFFSTIVIILNPAPIFHREARWWIVRSTVRVLTAGLVRVEVSTMICIVEVQKLMLANSFETSGSAINSFLYTIQAIISAFWSAHTRIAGGQKSTLSVLRTLPGQVLSWFLCPIYGVLANLYDVITIHEKFCTYRSSAI